MGESTTSSNVTWHGGQVTAPRTGAPPRRPGRDGLAHRAVGVGEVDRGRRPSRSGWSSQGRRAYRLDGDNLRTGLNGDLGFSREDREENVRRAAEVALLFADAGLVALVALISPYAESRQPGPPAPRGRRARVRRGLHGRPGRRCAPAAIRRGSTPRRRPGTSASFTGVDDPYEVPVAPDLVIESGTSLGDAIDTVLAALRRAEDALAARSPSEP